MTTNPAIRDYLNKFTTLLDGFEKVLADKTDRNVLRQLTMVVTDDATFSPLVNIDGNALGFHAFAVEDLFRDNDEKGAVQTFGEFDDAVQTMLRWNAMDEVQKSGLRVKAQNALEVVELQTAWLREQVEAMTLLVKEG